MTSLETGAEDSVYLLMMQRGGAGRGGVGTQAWRAPPPAGPAAFHLQSQSLQVCALELSF